MVAGPRGGAREQGQPGVGVPLGGGRTTQHGSCVNLSAKQITPGGADTSNDDATGDTLTLTGSGQFTPSRRVASGGGTFVHKHADGTVFAQGFYYVTKFRIYRVGGGEAPKGFADRVAGNGQGTPLDGILSLTVRAVPLVDGKPQTPNTATLTINCSFEHNHLGLKDSDEGFRLTIGTFKFKPTQLTPATVIGATVFHRLR
jgi:hypothetical protein